MLHASSCSPAPSGAVAYRLLLALAVLAYGSVFFAAATAAPTACGSAHSPCPVPGGGDYHLVVPNSPPGPEGYPVIVHLHGWSSSGRQVLTHWGDRLVEPAISRGYVVVIPNGEIAASGKRDWAVRDGKQAGRRDELAFLKRVLADVENRVALDRSRAILSGFSRGGSKVWDIACEEPGSFSAFAPLSGGFWNPLPETCNGPVRLFHVHGWQDATVPLEGRRLGDSGLVQGDIFAALSIMRAASRCDRRTADQRRRDGELWTRIWTTCAPGSQIRFTMFPGGHYPPQGWISAVLNWFETPVDAVQPDREVRVR